MGIGAGDFDLDGIDELLVGSPGDDEASLEAGATYLVSVARRARRTSRMSRRAVFLGGQHRRHVWDGDARPRSRRVRLRRDGDGRAGHAEKPAASSSCTRCSSELAASQ